MTNTDLHIHSCYSNDGEFSVADIISRSLARGIDCLAITDHNSVMGIGEAVSLTQDSPLDFIPGIEIDCNYEGTDLHLLGYGIDWKSTDFLELEERVSAKVMDSFADMIDNILRLGFAIDADSVLTKAGGKPPTGELIAEVMLSDAKYYSPLLAPYMTGGERSNMPYINFYLDYFAQGKPAFVPVEYMSYRDAIEMVMNNGGTPIVAHPGLNLRGQESIVEKLLNNGAAGIEVFNNYHTPNQINYFASLVQQRECIMTCGSDFHGKTKPLINIGQFNFDRKFEKYLTDSINRLKSGTQN